MLAPIGSRAFSTRETALEMWPPRDERGRRRWRPRSRLGEADAVDRHRVERLRRPCRWRARSSASSSSFTASCMSLICTSTRVSRKRLNSVSAARRRCLAMSRLNATLSARRKRPMANPSCRSRVDRRAEARVSSAAGRRGRERLEVEEDRVLDVAAGAEARCCGRTAPVSAASMSGGGLKVPLPKELLKPSPSGVEVRLRQPLAAEAGVEERQPREGADAARQWRCACWCRSCGSCRVSMKLAPALVWQMLQRPRCGSRNACRPVLASASNRLTWVRSSSLVRPSDCWNASVSVQLLRRRQAEVDAGHARQRLGVVLGDRAGQELSAATRRRARRRRPSRCGRSAGWSWTGRRLSAAMLVGHRQHVRHRRAARTCASDPRIRRRSRRMTPLLEQAVDVLEARRAPGWSRTRTADRSGCCACSALTKAESIVVLFSAGWQVPQVRPLPLNVSRKKMSAPAQTCAVTRPVTTRGSCAHAARRCGTVRSLWVSATGSACGPPQPVPTAPAMNEVRIVSRKPLASAGIDVSINMVSSLARLGTWLSVRPEPTHGPEAVPTPIPRDRHRVGAGATLSRKSTSTITRTPTHAHGADAVGGYQPRRARNRSASASPML